MREYKYFISFVDDNERHFDGIFEFTYNILEDENYLTMAKDQVSMNHFGESKEIAFINIIPLTTKNK